MNNKLQAKDLINLGLFTVTLSLVAVSPFRLGLSRSFFLFSEACGR